MLKPQKQYKKKKLLSVQTIIRVPKNGLCKITTTKYFYEKLRFGHLVSSSIKLSNGEIRTRKKKQFALEKLIRRVTKIQAEGQNFSSMGMEATAMHVEKLFGASRGQLNHRCDYICPASARVKLLTSRQLLTSRWLLTPDQRTTEFTWCPLSPFEFRYGEKYDSFPGAFESTSVKFDRVRHCLKPKARERMEK